MRRGNKLVVAGPVGRRAAGEHQPAGGISRSEAGARRAGSARQRRRRRGGPAPAVISTWTAAGADLAHTAGFLADGRVRSCRWLVDFSFPSRQPAYCAQLVERFGADSMRFTANHAKFVVMRNASWNMVLRTS